MVCARAARPLSVTLFNLFIADLDAHLKSKCTPGTGVQVVRSLAGSTPEELQELLDAFAAYCVANALIINPSKWATSLSSPVEGHGQATSGLWMVKLLPEYMSSSI